MGFLLALVSSAAFGLIPLFSLPLLHDGMSAECVLFYRFLFGALTIFPIPVLRHERLAAPVRELSRLAVLSIMYALAALLMFQGFHYLPSGVASTLQFLYPLMVMIIMIVFFHEKPSLITATSVALAILGVFLLSGGEGEGAVSAKGIVLLLVSALCNAVYISGLHVARIRSISGLSITFWVLFFGMLASLVNALVSGTFVWLQSWSEAALAVLLAVITAAVSNLTLVLAIQRIGSTMASILGVMEPVTAVTVGILVFDEPATAGVFAGVAVICFAVLLVMAGPQIVQRLKKDRLHASK
ncbi:DMT family transporter [uncultured Mailhella sp.]|uniref:DMT family transporter n=1 Tax=uncultured Mailhella sp. TaxID=1981031 RepID=UPI0025EDE48B|nr:DMT family transporter [uncultured Mailhella sp.]